MGYECGHGCEYGVSMSMMVRVGVSEARINMRTSVCMRVSVSVRVNVV